MVVLFLRKQMGLHVSLESVKEKTLEEPLTVGSSLLKEEATQRDSVGTVVSSL